MIRHFIICDGSFRFCIGNDGIWKVGAGSKTVALSNRSSFVAALPLLEEDPNASSVRELTDGTPPFPVDELILHALQFSSGYWKERALTWLEVVGVRSNELKEELTSIFSAESVWSQALRHRARRLVRSGA